MSAQLSIFDTYFFYLSFRGEENPLKLNGREIIKEREEKDERRMYVNKKHEREVHEKMRKLCTTSLACFSIKARGEKNFSSFIPSIKI
jgi:hypothetical protein